MAKVIMIQGTMSNAGKSLLVGGLCRIFHRDGLRVAPFKSQNMALNSYITSDGLEMGRAQVMQAEAAGIEPAADMNPLLLKPSSDMGSQVIVQGKVWGNLTAAQYYREKKRWVPVIMESYRRLADAYDVIVIEGAGSPAEINLREHDIVNMGLAQMVDAPVLLAGDIDRGGVFAQLAGTLLLLSKEEKKRVKGTIINKFRGDVQILRPGLSMLEERTGVPVCGVVPYMDVDIDEEDSLTSRFAHRFPDGLVDIAVIRLPHISNFTDFAPLESMPEAGVRYVRTPDELGSPDAVLLPGSKNTIEDLLWLRQSGLEARIVRYAGQGGIVLGICGGYQMLGESLADPLNTESGKTERGMGLLPIHTVFSSRKHTVQTKGKIAGIGGPLARLAGAFVKGYEIHMGETTIRKPEEAGCFVETGRPDGCWMGSVYGTYLHGFFDESRIAQGFLQALLAHSGKAGRIARPMDRSDYKELQYDRLADTVRRSLDMEMIYEILEKGNRYTWKRSSK